MLLEVNPFIMFLIYLELQNKEENNHIPSGYIYEF